MSVKLLKLVASFLVLVPAVLAHEGTVEIGTATETTTTSIATAAGYLDHTYIADATLWQRFTQSAPDWLVSGIPILIGAMLLFRLMAEGLLLVAKATKSKIDDEAAQCLMKVSYSLARVLSYIGVGMPSTFVLDRAEAIKAKAEASNANAGTATTDNRPKDGPSVT